MSSFTNAQNVGSFITTPQRYANDIQVYEDAYGLALSSGIRYLEVWNADLLDPTIEPFLMAIDAQLESTGWYQSYESAATTRSMTLGLSGLPEPNLTMTLTLEQGPGYAVGAFVFGLQRNDLPLWGFGSLLVGPESNLLIEACTLDAGGQSSLSFVLGSPITFRAQALAYDSSQQAWQFSNGIEIRVN